MRWFPTALAMAALLAVAPALAAPSAPPTAARTRVGEAVVPAGKEELILRMTKPEAGFPKGWALQAAQVKVISILATYKGPGGIFALELAAPGTPGAAVGATDKFTLLAADPKRPPPKALVRALEKQVRKHEADFNWSLQLSAAATPYDPLNRTGFDLPDALRRQINAAWDLLAAGKTDEALALAQRLDTADAGVPGKRAAAAVLRAAGRPVDAAGLLAIAASTPENPMDLKTRVEWLASLEAARRTDEAARLARDLAHDYPRIFDHPQCARADALYVLLQDGRVADAVDRGPRGTPELAFPECPCDRPCTDLPQPRCVHLYQLKAASAANDDAGIDRRAAVALAEYPEDPDLLFLWGTHYYRKMELLKVIPIWERLVPRHPEYPTALGQYGTAWLVGGRLDMPTINAFLAKYKADPKDIVSAYLAGLGLYYQKDYKAVIPLLEPAARAFPEEPRARMYLAMAHFFAGDRDYALREMEALEPFAYQEPDVNYCRSLIYRSFDLPRAIREMEIFLEVFEGEKRLRFGEWKVQKAKSDLERMRRGEVPEVTLPTPDVETPAPPPRPH